MSDYDRNGDAWLVSPSQYLETRKPGFALPAAPRAQYLTMRDGCRLAIDIYLPQSGANGAPPEKLPAIMVLTPYYRRFKLRDGASAATDPSPSAGRYRDF